MRLLAHLLRADVFKQEQKWRMIAQLPHWFVGKNLAVSDQLCRRDVDKRMVTLIWVPRLPSPEALDLSTCGAQLAGLGGHSN